MTQKIDQLFLEEEKSGLKAKYRMQVIYDGDVAEELDFTSATDFHFFVRTTYWDKIFDYDLDKVLVIELATKKIVYDSRKD